jgi:crotonobetainyl-CoA:carnitine CoA-transferase CaiB-like acyl-CoA transferase
MLEGVRILDLSDERGHLAGKILGDLGADVIKIEPPGGDPLRRRGPFLGSVEDPERSLAFLALNTSKRSVTLDLDRDREALLQLVDSADALLETARPGDLATRGIGYPQLSARNPRLVYCALTPFGQTGPYASYRAHDLVVVAMGGNAQVTGDPDRPPLRCTMPTAYYHAAPEAALGIVMALFGRARSGRGQLVDVSMHECQLQTLLSFPGQFAMGERERATRVGAKIGRTREIWRAQDGWVTFGLRGGKTRIPNLIATVAYMDEEGMAPAWLKAYDWASYNHNTLPDAEIARLEEAFAAFFRSKPMRELYQEALKRRILLAPCNDAREILAQPQLRFRELFVTLDYPHLGARIEHPGFFAKGGGVGAIRRAPRLGEHNAELLGAR